MAKTIWRETVCKYEAYLNEEIRRIIEDDVARTIPEGWRIVGTRWVSVDSLSPTFDGKNCSYYVFAREEESD